MKRRRRTNRYGRIALVCWLLLVLLAGCFVAGHHIRLWVEEQVHEHLSPIPGPSRHAASPSVIPVGSLYSHSAILLSLDDQEVLLDVNSKDKVYPASLTKIMAAIIAIEHIPDVSRSVLLPADIFADLSRENASMAGFLPGDEVAAIDLLYGALLPSGAECSVALAIAAAGSEADFVQLMNRKAEQLGMQGTHFANTTGLHDPDHYSTPEDLAIMLQYALQNDLFREVFTTVRHSTAPSKRQPEGITFFSSMFAKMSSAEVPDGVILGGKTGYTDQAGLCLASLASIAGKEYILVTTGAPGTPQSEPLHIADALQIYGKIGRSNALRNL